MPFSRFEVAFSVAMFLQRLNFGTCGMFSDRFRDLFLSENIKGMDVSLEK